MEIEPNTLVSLRQTAYVIQMVKYLLFIEMAEAVEAAGAAVERAGPSSRDADADAEAEQRRRQRDPPILFTDVDVSILELLALRSIPLIAG